MSGIDAIVNVVHHQHVRNHHTGGDVNILEGKDIPGLIPMLVVAKISIIMEKIPKIVMENLA
ncbi:hypothetical protein [Calothrix sp. NIES-3974]|uniref:hypothetical protein n=1 Tax=Calothrix sp. NIES-3974 TaxID=2005462 RepID=UPI000BBC3C6F|nr:hypothetical protein [Calothrix sp. NIES-3974]